MPLLLQTVKLFISSSLLRPRPLPTSSSLLRPHPGPFCSSSSLLSNEGPSACGSTRPPWLDLSPEELSLFNGVDFLHWLVVMDPPNRPFPVREDLINEYCKTLALVVGSEEEARKKIYSVSTAFYFSFGALVPEDIAYRIVGLPRVRLVFPDAYVDREKKEYGGEPFINGEAVPYDPKFHESWYRTISPPGELPQVYDYSTWSKIYDNPPAHFQFIERFWEKKMMKNKIAPPPLPSPPPVHNT